MAEAPHTTPGLRLVHFIARALGYILALIDERVAAARMTQAEHYVAPYSGACMEATCRRNEKAAVAV